MSTCLICGKKATNWLCSNCAGRTDVEDLCNKIISYWPCRPDNPEANPIWDKIASGLEFPSYFKNIAFDVADLLPSPRKEWQKLHSLVVEETRVPRIKKEWFYQLYDAIIDSTELTEIEKQRLKGLKLEALFQDYRYSEADELAYELVEESPEVWQVLYVMAEFFSQTRRYDEAEEAISRGKELFAENKKAMYEFNTSEGKNNSRRTAAETGKKEYIPAPKEGKAEAVAKYTEFMLSLGIDINTSSVKQAGRKRYPTPISNAEYPIFVEITDPSFDSFVAYDLETTGLDPKLDAIIEIGAVKVVDGVVSETAKFTFQEFVKPYKKGVSEDVTRLTGISKDDVKNARQMWEVIPDFMKFAGNNVLVGFNNALFDSKFLRRAGRYSGVIYTNKQFDVLNYAKRIKQNIGYTGENTKLGTISEYLGIKNPSAHRALADAITTAKVFLKLKEINKD